MLHVAVNLRGQEAAGDLIHTDADLQGGQQPAAAHQREEGLVVGPSDAIVEPVAVVVKVLHTSATTPTVFAALVHIRLHLHPILSGKLIYWRQSRGLQMLMGGRSCLTQGTEDLETWTDLHAA